MLPMPGTACLMARMARLHRLSARQASSPAGDFSAAGTTGKSASAGMPSSAASPATSTSAGIEWRKMPGIEPIGSRAAASAWTKTGQIRSSTPRRCSATKRRVQASVRLRRRRTRGYCPVGDAGAASGSLRTAGRKGCTRSVFDMPILFGCASLAGSAILDRGGAGLHGGVGGCDLSARRPGEDLHELGDLAALLAGVAAGNRALDAMADMVAQHLVLDPLQGRPRGGDLGQAFAAV